MIRARAVKRKEHMGLVWSPQKKKFVQRDPEELEKSASIFHAQTGEVSADEIEVPGGSSSPDGTVKSDIFSTGARRWKARLKTWTGEEPIFRRGMNVWRNFYEGEIKNLGETQESTEAYRLQRSDWSFIEGINWPAVAWGWVVALSLTIAVLGAAALYVAFTPGSVFYLSTYLLLNKVASPLVGGMVTGWRVERKGWQAGLWVGAGYGVAIMIFRLYGGMLSAFWLEVITGLAVSVLAGMVGGALGRGLAPDRNAKRTLRPGLKNPRKISQLYS